MKKLFTLFLSLLTAALCVSGCFKPDEDQGDADRNLLYGYWERVHMEEYYYNYIINADGSHSYTYEDYFSENITPGDGNEMYQVLLLTPSYLTLIATDCPDDEYMLMCSYPYSVSGDRLYGCVFEGDFCKYTSIKKLDEDYLVLYMEDIGTYSGEPMYEEYRSTMTYRRIKQK